MVEVDDTTVFDVKKVRKVVYGRSGKPIRFLISWDGFSSYEDSWVGTRELMVPAARFCEEAGFPTRLPPGPQRVVTASSADTAAAAGGGGKK